MKNSFLLMLGVIIFLVGATTGVFLTKTPQFSSSNVVLSKLPEKTLTATVPIVAVTASGDKGVLSNAVVEISPGKGRLLLNTNPFVEPDTQQSIETARTIAQQFTHFSLADKDVIYSIENSQAQLVGGPSAGGAFTVATIAAIENKTIKPDVAMTGTIEANGSIGKIGGVIEKAQAASEAGKKLFLVPIGQSKISYYDRQVTQEKRGNLTIQRTQYVPKTLDLTKYALEQWGIEVREIANIDEAVNLMIAA